jgi:hypothetical protein
MVGVRAYSSLILMLMFNVRRLWAVSGSTGVNGSPAGFWAILIFDFASRAFPLAEWDETGWEWWVGEGRRKR